RPAWLSQSQQAERCQGVESGLQARYGKAPLAGLFYCLTVGCVEDPLQVGGPCEHREVALLVARPLVPRTVVVELDAVGVRIVQVESLADPVVGRAAERDPGLDKPLQRSA